MPPPRRPRRADARPAAGATTALSLSLSLALALGCAGGRVRAGDESPPEVLLEVLPRAAEVTIDGLPLGRGSHAVTAPPGSGAHEVRVVAAGFAPLDFTLPPQPLADGRVAAALRPDGFGAERPLDYDEPEGLALAAAHLVRAGDPRDAADYAERARSLDPSLPLPWRVLGDARAALGEAGRAADAWTRYLLLAPGAPDAARVGRDLDRARASRTIELK